MNNTFTELTEQQDAAYLAFCDKHNLDCMMDIDEQVQYLRDIEEKTLAIRLKRIVFRDNAPKQVSKPVRAFTDGLIAMMPVINVIKATANHYKACRDAQALKTAKPTVAGLQLGLGF